MYRLLGFKNVNNARLIINRHNLVESTNTNVKLLNIHKTPFLVTSGKFLDLTIVALRQFLELV